MSSIAAQATAIELAFLNARGHRDVIADLVAKRKRPQHELDQLNRQVAELEPAVSTMKWLALNHADILEALGGAA